MATKQITLAGYTRVPYKAKRKGKLVTLHRKVTAMYPVDIEFNDTTGELETNSVNVQLSPDGAFVFEEILCAESINAKIQFTDENGNNMFRAYTDIRSVARGVGGQSEKVTIMGRKFSDKEVLSVTFKS